MNSYYCPQRPLTSVYFANEEKWWLESKTPPHMDIQEFIKRSEGNKFRYFFLPIAHLNRRNDTARTVPVQLDESSFRFGKYIVPAMASLEPLFKGPFSAVYDGPEMIAKLKELSGK
jgi:hypothetical protein